MFKNYIPRPTKREYFSILILVIEFAFFAIFAPNFLNAKNLVRIVQNNAEIAIISIGMTLVMLLGGIDLSVGSVMGVVAVVAGTMIENGWGSLAALCAAVLIGILLGAVNGVIITKLRVPDMIATLATGDVWKAVIFALLGGKWITSLKPGYRVITTGKLFGIPYLLFVLIAVYALFYYILMHRRFGRDIYAIGSNENAARLCGINVDRVRFVSYCITGALAGITGLLYIARMGSVEMTIGTSMAIQAIAAVTIGGIGMKGSGARGSVIGTLAGVFFIGILSNGIVIMGIPSLLEDFFIGLTMALCILVDAVNLIRKRRANIREGAKKA
jgi:ribose transport system permease protein/AI-2 transport system permease protein